VSTIRRRELILRIAGGAALIRPIAARAQQRPVIGFLSSRSPMDSVDGLAAFRRGLGQAGYEDGRNIAIEFRWAEGQYDRLEMLAAELVNRPVAVLVAVGGEPAALAAKAATATIPIVFSIGGDPTKLGLAASFQHPGGNATGISLLTTQLEPKRLGLLHDLLPGATVFGALVDPRFQPAEDQAKELEVAARAIDRRLILARVSDDAELDAAFEMLVEQQASGLLVTASPFFDTRSNRIIAFAARQGMPAIYQFREFALAGGLIVYGVSFADGYRQVGDYAGRILRGAFPAELPILQSVKFELVINLKTARALGLIVPPILLAQANEVIE
jgi:putative ABC transport system substrate-binding protein